VKTRQFIIIAGCSLLLPACDKGAEEKSKVEATAADKDFRESDMPILPVKKGDYWKYNVHVEVPAGITSEGAAAVDFDTEKTRTYLGKIDLSGGRPPTDAFDVVVPGQAVERELVEIHDDKVMMRGSVQPEMPDAKVRWLDPAIPFVIAGMRAGQEMRSFTIADGATKRGMKVIARESVKVPAGEYPSIRMLMTGNDGQIEIRRTTWFSPGIGIVKEEKTRYAGEKLLLREKTELLETTITRD
jgi:hypothetical protein